VARKPYTSHVETLILRTLADAWNRFCRLETQHPQEKAEFLSAINAAQNVLAVRVARRADPEVWLVNPADVGAIDTSMTSLMRGPKEKP
jgi:hypothetical protein